MKIQQKGTLIFVSVIMLLYILSQPFSTPSITENQSKFNEYVREIDINPPKTAISMEWNETWDSGLIGYSDFGENIATDSEGNLYVAGVSEIGLPYDCYAFLIKYDSKGNYLWNKTWHAGSIAQAWDIINDTSDNVYIAGASGAVSNVIKFNSTGDVQWNETYIESNWLSGIIYCSDGFIYATGSHSMGGPSGCNITLLKINSTTGQLDDIGNYESYNLFNSGRDVAIDSLNFIYVTGRNETLPGDDDIILLKFDSSCNLIWNVTWNNTISTTHDEKGYGLAIDSQDYIYVTGSNQTGSDYDIILLKYDNEGNLLWQKSWDNSNGEDIGCGIDIDSEDSIYIIGEEQNSTGHKNSILIKFDDNGNQIWNQSWGGIEDDEGNGILVVNSENIFITGATDSYAKGDKPDVFLAYFQDDLSSNSQTTQPLSISDDDDDDGGGKDRFNIIKFLTGPIGLIIIGGLIGIIALIVIIKIRSSSKSSLK